MALHESFWVVAGAAAPVIALAEIVSLGDAARGRTETLKTQVALPDEKVPEYMAKTKPGQTRRRQAVVTGQANMVLQVVILAFALAFLTARRDVIPLQVIVTILQPLGLVALLVSAWMMNLADRQQLPINVAYRKEFAASSKDPPAS